MAGETNKLVAWIKDAGEAASERRGSLAHYDAREYDVVVASGEQVTIGPSGHRAACDGREGAVLAGLANADHAPTARMAPRES